jgi:hypothetical protein
MIRYRDRDHRKGEGETRKADRDYDEHGCANGKWHDSDYGPLVLLAYKERDPAERELWDMMADETGIVLECREASWSGRACARDLVGKRRRR